MAPPAPTLLEALRAADAAARADDAAVLAAAVQRCVELCARMDEVGAPPPPAELRELIELHRALLARAEAARDRLGQELARAVRSTRAASAYAGR